MTTYQEQLVRVLGDPHRLAMLRRTGLLDSPPEAAFDRLTRLASKILRAPVSLVSLVDDHRQYFKSGYGLQEPYTTIRETPLSHSFCQHVVGTHEPLIISDARRHPLVHDSLGITELGVIAYAGIPLTLPNGETLGSFCVVDMNPREWSAEDIEILRELAESVITEIELRLHAQDLQRANEALETYSYTIAHDLRNPLTSIQGNVEVVLRYGSGGLRPDFQRALEDVLKTTQRMGGMIAELLALAQLKETDVNPHPIAVQQILDDVLARHRDTITTRQITIERSADLPAVLGHEAWLDVVFANLVSNALKYIGKDNPQPHIAIRGRLNDKGWAYYEIEDNGVGIALEDQTRLFKRFSRLHENEADGLGLGLSIVKQLVQRMDGQIGVRSAVGQGSTFWLLLPHAS